MLKAPIVGRGSIRSSLGPQAGARSSFCRAHSTVVASATDLGYCSFSDSCVHANSQNRDHVPFPKAPGISQGAGTISET
jgi:hypothetical protein